MFTIWKNGEVFHSAKAMSHRELVDMLDSIPDGGERVYTIAASLGGCHGPVRWLASGEIVNLSDIMDIHQEEPDRAWEIASLTGLGWEYACAVYGDMSREEYETHHARRLQWRRLAQRVQTMGTICPWCLVSQVETSYESLPSASWLRL